MKVFSDYHLKYYLTHDFCLKTQDMSFECKLTQLKLDLIFMFIANFLMPILTLLS